MGSSAARVLSGRVSAEARKPRVAVLESDHEMKASPPARVPSALSVYGWMPCVRTYHARNSAISMLCLRRAAARTAWSSLSSAASSPGEKGVDPG